MHLAATSLRFYCCPDIVIQFYGARPFLAAISSSVFRHDFIYAVLVLVFFQFSLSHLHRLPPNLQCLENAVPSCSKFIRCICCICCWASINMQIWGWWTADASIISLGNSPYSILVFYLVLSCWYVSSPQRWFQEQI